jgi:hypothetical protein
LQRVALEILESYEPHRVVVGAEPPILRVSEAC